MNYSQAKKKLEQYDQTHLLAYWEDLGEAEQEQLLSQIEDTSFEVLQSLKEKALAGERGVITPLAAMELEEIESNRSRFAAIGLEALQAGKVGAVLLAGGMGTRLGSNDPKGMYDIGITKPVYIFQRLVENLLEVVKQADTWIPLYVMTSDKNHQVTVDFFKQHEFFGYQEEKVTFFMQDMAPATDFNGKVLLEEKGKIATSPNGNGGWYSSMHKWGVARKAAEQGVEWLNVFAVDNVLQRIADPVFIGATIDRGCVAGAKVVRKNAPREGVGVMCLEDGRPSIVEYYDLTEELMEARDAKGDPAYNFGVILNYLFRVESLEEIMEKKLPLHVVEKKILCLDQGGTPVNPQEPNGYKFEQLVLDMIHELDSCLPYEVVRNKEFAPIKNKTGVDSVESARKLCGENGIEL